VRHTIILLILSAFLAVAIRRLVCEASDMNTTTSDRRNFLVSAGTGILTSAVAVASSQLHAANVPQRSIKLGFDNFAVRAMKWNARQLIDHSVLLGCDSLFITDFSPLEGKHDEKSLADIRAYGDDRGISIELGSWSICPTSTQFKKDWGTAEEHLALGIRMSKAIGSRYFRTILGNQSDRLTDGGIEARIADTIQVLLSLRSRAIDSNIKIAVENHAGDMQAWELKGLVEAAGPEYVGVNFDSGNACWSLEDPFHALTLLAPYVLTTSLRDTMVWESATGVTAQWTAMGEGCVDMPALFDLFENKCPGVAVHIETISGFPREFPLFKSDFWKAFPKARAADLAAFMALSKRGRPIDPFKAPENSDRAKAEQDYQLDQISRSIRFCKEKLRLGVRV
jgi:sugar phosphate isomerase/epimerase